MSNFLRGVLFTIYLIQLIATFLGEVSFLGMDLGSNMPWSPSKIVWVIFLLIGIMSTLFLVEW